MLRLAALVSGGKDSLYAAWLCETHGWPVEQLITLTPTDTDSMLFHTPNLGLVSLLAKAWGKPHASVPVEGTEDAKEIRALSRALASLRGEGYRGVVAGAIGSTYQWANFWHAAHQAGLEVFAPLWRATPLQIVREEIEAGLDIRVAEVASEGLTEAQLGRPLDKPFLAAWERSPPNERRFHIAGEGGEYETVVLDAPFLLERVEVVRSHVERSGAQGRWIVDEAKLVRKGFTP